MRATRSRFLARARARAAESTIFASQPHHSAAHDLPEQNPVSRYPMGSSVPTPPPPETIPDSDLNHVTFTATSKAPAANVTASPVSASHSTSSRAHSFSAAAQSGKARFRVKFSDVGLVFPAPFAPSSQNSSTQAYRNAHLTFSFDSFWTAETSQIDHSASAPDIEDASATRYPLQFVSFAAQFAKPKVLDEPMSDLRFIYETSLAHKLHRKCLVVTLNSASRPAPTAVISVDSLARGCQRIALSLHDPTEPNRSPVAVASFRVSMLHYDRVQAVISDLKVVDYPEKHIHDVKLVFLEMGYRPFAEGYISSTEKSSDSEPVFVKLPTLERVCSLQEMLHGGATTTDLRIFFSLHRQVARARTEEIGLGALPVHMLFSRIEGGHMEVPSKFKVPLAGYKGIVKGKVMLYNISQWSQLGGDDLLNRDGVILPSSVDLQTRKLLPWLLLPRNTQPIGVPSPAVRPYSSPNPPQLLHSSASAESAGSGSMSEPNSFGHMHPPPSAKWPETSNSSAYLVLPPNMAPSHAAYVPQGQGNLAIPQATVALHTEGTANALSDNGSAPANVAVTPATAAPAVSAGNKQNIASEYYNAYAHHGAVSNDSARFSSAVAYGDPPALLRQASNAYDYYNNHYQAGSFAQEASSVYPEKSLEGEQETQMEYQRQREQYQRQQQEYYLAVSGQQYSHVEQAQAEGGLDLQFQNLQVQDSVEQDSSARSHDSHSVTVTGKSAKSVGSSTAGPAESADHSNGSGDCALLQPVVLTDKNVEQGSSAVQGATVGVPTAQFCEWVAVKDVNSDNYYFANYYTNESLWLPPLWERLFDEHGYEFFVDHGSKTTQRQFPAEQARSYRESVSADLIAAEKNA